MHGLTSNDSIQPLITTDDTEGIPLLNATELTAVPELPEDDNSNNAYHPLTESDPYTALYSFFNSIDIDREDIQQAGISEPHLLKLYQKETGWFSFLQWCSIDHIVEKTLQWPLLSPKDVSESASESWFRRVRPQGRSILLKNVWGLMKAYGIRGFTKGVETSLTEFVHYFIYAMLTYRLINWAMTGQNNFEEFQSLFQDSNQKGIDSLVIALAKLEAKWLRLILVSPILIGALQSIVSVWSTRKISPEQLRQITNDISEQLGKSSSFYRDTVREKLSILPGVRTLGSRVQKLEQLTRWDGRLTFEDRRKSFESIQRAAKESHQIAQLNILESLTKIVHGVGLKDLPRLYAAGYFKTDLLEILYAKTTALKELEDLSQTSIQTWKAKLTSTPRQIYSTYLLWWLGLSTSFWKQRLPFFIFKAVKLAIEIFFLQKIAESILEAINCPDKPGFQFGDGYQDWASDYTAECFTTRLTLFRTMDVNESVDALVAEIPRYHLTELTSLDLYQKYLTEKEASQIIQAVLQQKAPLKTLDLNVNKLNVLNKEMLNGLTQLNYLNLGYNKLNTLSDGVFSGLSQLNYLYLYNNQLSTLSNGVFSGLSQLNTLYLDSNQLSTLSTDVFNGLSQLNFLSLSSNQLSAFNDEVFRGLSQLNRLDLRSNQLSTLSSGIFSRLSQLNRLVLFNNQLSTLSNDVFSGLSKLNYLDLGFNKLSTLCNDIFSSLSQLNSLDLSSNKLSTLCNDVFSSLSQLNRLVLFGNQLSTLSNSVFSGLSQLNNLDLRFNQLDTFSSFTLNPLNQLLTLLLNENYFNTTAMMGIITQLPPSLTELDIALNPMNDIPQNFSTLLPISLQSLSIGGRYIPRILTREFMQHFPFRLTAISIEFSFITNIIEGTFLDFSDLRSFSLFGNRLRSLNNGVFGGLSQLNFLYLSSNRLRSLSNGVFSELSQLNSLDLSSNRFRSLSNGVFSGLSQLNDLNLWGNQLSTLSDGVFSELSQLNSLYLTSNRLSTLSDGVFSGLRQLNSLSLDGNQLSILSNGVFSGLSQLNHLGLGGNQLSTLNDSVFSGLSQLNRLVLHSNQLNALSYNLFNGLNQLTLLLLGSNYLNDTAIKNLTRNFPYHLNDIDLTYNNIGNEGALALAELIPCTNLTRIDFDGNLANDTSLNLAAQEKALRKICEDQRCHANLPASQSCNVPQTGLNMMTWERESSIEMPDKDSFTDMKSSTDSYAYSFFASHSFTPSSLPSLPSPDFLTKDSLATAGTMAGIIGFSVLLYKNATMVKTVVNAGCQLLKGYFDRTCDNLKTATNFYSFHSPHKTRKVLYTDTRPTTAFNN